MKKILIIAILTIIIIWGIHAVQNKEKSKIENESNNTETVADVPKEDITIFELKKTETTLEDAFIKLIDTKKEEEK